MVVEARVMNNRLTDATARTRLEALDHWLDDQEAKGVPLSVHALLTHVVDEAGATCGELQQGVDGTTEVIIASRDRDEAPPQ